MTETELPTNVGRPADLSSGQQEALFRTLFELSPDAILAVNERSEIVLLNQQAEVLFGYHREELLGQSIELLVPESAQARHQEHVKHYLERPRLRLMGHHMPLSGQRKDGSLFPADILLDPVQTEKGNLVLVNVRDITERRQAEETLARYRDELEELVEARTAELSLEIERRQAVELDLKEYVERLARSNRDLEDFASIVSHDLQEPLRKIQAFGERLVAHSGETLSAEGRDSLERMQSASTRISEMLTALLNYSRVNSHAGLHRPVNLCDAVAEALTDLELRLEETGGQVHVRDLPTIEAEPVQMRQLFLNLIGNALKFHRLDIPPVVKVYATGSGQIIVEDNGIGFEEQYLDQIFQPFQRLHGRQIYPGTGMGLAICRKIVERHGGRITAHSQPGQGTQFIIESLGDAI